MIVIIISDYDTNRADIKTNHFDLKNMKSIHFFASIKSSLFDLKHPKSIHFKDLMCVNNH